MKSLTYRIPQKEGMQVAKEIHVFGKLRSERKRDWKGR